MSSSDELLARYEADVDEAFGFLRTQYGCVKARRGMHVPECWVGYQNRHVRITVSFELGSGPWVVLERRSWFRFWIDDEGYDLVFLLMERAPDEYKRRLVKNVDDPALRDELRRLASLLREHGDDVLRGDFQVFPRLRTIAKEHFERTSLERYGRH
ncbi:MAG TPA: hypothetical protein VGF28_13100 [Thermoanaerobaculia bacterium]|jgi:hypothetical protein